MFLFLRRLLGGAKGSAEDLEAWLRVERGVIDLLGTAQSVRDAAPGLLSTIGTTLGWDLGAFWALDEREGRLYCLAVWLAPDVAAPAFEKATRAAKFVRGEGFPGSVWDALEPVWFEDYGQEGLARAPAAREDGLKAALCFPVHAGRRVFGAVEFLSRESHRPLPEMLAVADTLGLQIGQAFVREHSVRRLAEQERRFADFVENAPVGFHATDGKGVVLVANRTFLEALGRRSRDVVARPVGTLFEDPRVSADLVARVRAREPVEGVDARMLHANGSVRWIRLWANGLFERDELSYLR